MNIASALSTSAFGGKPNINNRNNNLFEPTWYMVDCKYRMFVNQPCQGKNNQRPDSVD